MSQTLLEFAEYIDRLEPSNIHENQIKLYATFGLHAFLNQDKPLVSPLDIAESAKETKKPSTRVEL